MTQVHLIVAMDQEGGISLNGDIPWHIPSDLKLFQQITSNHIVVMGRKTWESIPIRFRPLKNRVNYVCTRDPSYRAEGAWVLHSFENILTIPVFENKKLFVIGGKELYEWCMRKKIVVHLYITCIYHDFNCDNRVFFTPEWLNQSAEWVQLRHDDIPLTSLELRAKMKYESPYLVDYKEYILASASFKNWLADMQFPFPNKH